MFTRSIQNCQLSGRATLPYIVFFLTATSCFAQTPPPGYEIADRYFNGERARDDVRFLTDYWRIGGGADFSIALDRWHAELLRSGFRDTTRSPLAVNMLTGSDTFPVWVPFGGSLEILAPEQKVLHTYTDTPVFLVQNSLATPPEGIAAPLIYVPAERLQDPDIPARVADYIILTNAPVRAVIAAGLASSGAFGVLSSWAETYNEPGANPDLIAQEDLPLPNRFPASGFFAVKVSHGTGVYLLQRLTAGPVRVRVTSNTRFTEGRLTTLAAEITGREKPDERIVFVTHIDHYKPGANDNASGAATLLEMARACAAAITQGDLPRPARTLTFLWGDEYNAVPHWRRAYPGIEQTVKAAIVLDMTGAETALTGGVFRMERAPDPGALWTRPPDAHTPWGQGTPPRMFGTYLNDWFRSVCRYRADQTGWTIAENPYEGGSDHDSFLALGIPALLAWHFTDRYYHSSQDTFDKVSAEEMKHVGVSTLCAALGLASPDGAVLDAIHRAVALQAMERIAQERSTAVRNIAAARDQQAVRKDEARILTAWRQWYGEAFASIGEVPLGTLPEKFALELEASLDKFLKAADEPLK